MTTASQKTTSPSEGIIIAKYSKPPTVGPRDEQNTYCYAQGIYNVLFVFCIFSFAPFYIGTFIKIYNVHTTGKYHNIGIIATQQCHNFYSSLTVIFWRHISHV